jgi:gas vesicle structural protein
MAITTTNQGPSGGSLGEVLGLILDRGVVIDAFVRVSLVGIEILTIDARVVVASVDTYLRYAEAVGRVSLDTGKAGLPQILAARQAKAALEAAQQQQMGVIPDRSEHLEPQKEQR